MILNDDERIQRQDALLDIINHNPVTPPSVIVDYLLGELRISARSEGDLRCNVLSIINHGRAIKNLLLSRGQ